MFFIYSERERFREREREREREHELARSRERGKGERREFKGGSMLSAQSPMWGSIPQTVGS